MKKQFLLIIILAVIIIILAGVLLIPGMGWRDKIIPDEDTFAIRNLSVKSGQEITSPLVVEGEARGTWFFEASFPIKITDEQGNALGISYAQAQSEWMTEDFVPFKGEITYVSKIDGNGFLVLEKDNPSGLPENADAIKIPVVLKKVGYIKVEVFFGNSDMDPEFSCNKVFPMERETLKTEAVARAAIEELLKGPTQQEKNAGYFSSIPEGSKLNSIFITDGIAKIDFDEIAESGGGSCSMAGRVAQITQTLKQFPTIKTIVISINGRTEDIFQP